MGRGFFSRTEPAGLGGRTEGHSQRQQHRGTELGRQGDVALVRTGYTFTLARHDQSGSPPGVPAPISQPPDGSLSAGLLRVDRTLRRSKSNPSCAARTRRHRPRSGRIASFRRLEDSLQHHPDPAACQMSRTQPARKHLAVHPRQLALKPHLQILRRHRRPLSPRLEHAHGSALENHVHRHARLDLPVLITESWYNPLSWPGATRSGYQGDLRRR